MKKEEAIEVIKKNLPDSSFTMLREALETLIPELKESEDEKIRKALRERIIRYDPNNEILIKEEGISQRQFLAWLEKKGEQKSMVKTQMVYPKFRIGDVISPNIEDGGGDYTIVGFNKTLADYLVDGGNVPHCSIGIEFIEKNYHLKEQKPTDKVGPKFKVGDWIVTNKNHIWYVDETPETTSYLYRLINQYGKVEVVEFEVVDKVARLWTIQDAKDGDVLAAHECLVLFKEIDGLNIRCYCTYHFMNNESFFVDTLQNKTAFTLATKEQRDLLFQKMHEASYNWDADKKELKKIEQKPQRIVSAEAKEAMYDKLAEWSEELAQAKKDAYNDALDKIEYHSGEPTFDDGWDAAIWYLKKRILKTI